MMLGINYCLLLVISVLLPFFLATTSFGYWFICVPRCRMLSCGKTLKPTKICPNRNPFRARVRQSSVTRRNAPEKLFVLSTRDGWIATNVTLIYVLNPSIMKSCFQILQSENICDQHFWTLDDSVLYGSSSHQTMVMFVAIPALLIYGFLCPFLSMLYIGRHGDRQTNRKLIFRFGLMYSGFAPKYWYYEGILFLRKITIILVVTFASSNEQQLHIAMGTLIVLFCLLEFLRPYSAAGAGKEDTAVQNRLHLMESLSLVILIGMVWSAVFFVLGCNDDSGLCSVLGVSVLSANILFVIGCAYCVGKAFQSSKVMETIERFGRKSKENLARKVKRLSSLMRQEVTLRNVPMNENDYFPTIVSKETGRTIKINPLSQGRTRQEFAAMKQTENREARGGIQMLRDEENVYASRSGGGDVEMVENPMKKSLQEEEPVEEPVGCDQMLSDEVNVYASGTGTIDTIENPMKKKTTSRMKRRSLMYQ